MFCLTRPSAIEFDLNSHLNIDVVALKLSTNCFQMSVCILLSYSYGVYASQLIRFSRCCSNYSDFLSRLKALVTRLLSQGF